MVRTKLEKKQQQILQQTCKNRLHVPHENTLTNFFTIIIMLFIAFPTAGIYM